MSKHTPGPWVLSRARHNNSLFVRESRNPCATAVARIGITHVDHDANARLIAAAPELYEALRGVLRVADRATVEFDAARAALAKADGDELKSGGSHE